MIYKIKYFSLVVFLLLLNSAFCQNIKVETIKDSDGIPFINFHSRTGVADSIVYIMPDGKKINVNLNVEYIGGWKSLDTFCDSLYYNRKNYNDQELNEIIKFSIVLDDNLHIQDIRILNHLLGYSGKYNYNELFKRILIHTEGKWKLKTLPSKTWHLYIGSHRFY
jgi:hypothetical protein